MTNTQQMLRRIDDELTYNRHQIALLRVKNSELEETRRNLMELEEADKAAAEFRRAAHAGLVPGSSAKPILVVRKAEANGHDHNAEEAPLGLIESGPRKGKPRLKALRKDAGKKKGKRSNSDLGKMRNRVLDFLKPGDEPVTSNEIANHFGLPAENDARKPLQNALYHMRVNGLIDRDDDGRYYRRTEPPQAVAQ